MKLSANVIIVLSRSHNNLYDQLNYNLHSCNCTNEYALIFYFCRVVTAYIEDCESVIIVTICNIILHNSEKLLKFIHHPARDDLFKRIV